MNAEGLTSAIGDGSGVTVSWLTQLGDMGSGTIQDSWDHNSGARNANIELVNRLIPLERPSPTLPIPAMRSRLATCPGTNRSIRYDGNEGDDDRPVAGFATTARASVWDAEATACVRRIDRQAELFLETQ